MEFLDHDDPHLRRVLFLHDSSADQEAEGVAEATREHEKTAGGIYGYIKEVQETTFLIEIAKDVCIKVDKGSIYTVAEDAQAAPAKD